ncbi:hypothetical protein Trydic_g2745 [Trypoxylus dichotomus]
MTSDVVQMKWFTVTTTSSNLSSLSNPTQPTGSLAGCTIRFRRREMAIALSASLDPCFIDIIRTETYPSPSDNVPTRRFRQASAFVGSRLLRYEKVIYDIDCRPNITRPWQKRWEISKFVHAYVYVVWTYVCGYIVTDEVYNTFRHAMPQKIYGNSRSRKERSVIRDSDVGNGIGEKVANGL